MHINVCNRNIRDSTQFVKIVKHLQHIGKVEMTCSLFGVECTNTLLERKTLTYTLKGRLLETYTVQFISKAFPGCPFNEIT